MSYALQETRYTEQLHSGNQATRQGLAVHIHIAHERCEHQIWEPVGRPTRRLFVGAAAVTEDKGHTPADLLVLLVLYPDTTFSLASEWREVTANSSSCFHDTNIKA